MDDRAQRLSVKTRLDRMLASEGVERQRSACIWITVALVIVAPVLVALAGWPEALYYHAILLVFILSAWLKYLFARRSEESTWFDYATVAFNFALISFTLIYPNPLSEASQLPYAPSLSLRTNNFIFFFLLLTSLAFSFSPLIMAWAGLCGALFWSIGYWWVLNQPGIEVFDPARHAPKDASTAEIEAARLLPQFVDKDIWLQDVTTFLLVAGLLALIVQGSRELLLRRALEERRGANLARYLPAQLAECMAESDTPFLEDREAEAAVLFSDIVGFTRWAEAHSPQEVVALLREVHGLVAEEVFRAEGVLDKFIGDGAMATFGVARTDPAPAARALGCVEAIVARASAYNAARVAQGKVPVRLSVGAHFGPVTIGDVGTEGRLELAVLGDAVNVASRLEALTRSIDVAAVVSGDLMDHAGGPRPGWVQRGEQSIRGRSHPVPIWSFDRPADNLA